MVACSGGLDSTVLLHLLCFSPGLGLRITAAHFDHRMRARSAGDGLWLAGLTRAWDLPLQRAAALVVPSGEGAAREARYRFLHAVRRSVGARRLLTAHHADDQAETVLFRVLRGTGIKGLGGIPEHGRDTLLRPLLPFYRAELESYASASRVPFRTDPTNLDTRFARNVIRSELLPRAEQAVAAGAKRSLVRLARLAREEEALWQALLPDLLAPLLREESPDRVVLRREVFLELARPVRARLLRELLGRFGVVPGEAGTRKALEFTSSGASGRALQLTGATVLAREFDGIVLVRRPTGGEESLEIPDPGEGWGCLTLVGRAHRVEWSRSGEARGAWIQTFATHPLAFPLRFRGWRPGDRMRLPYGSKKLGKLFAEARVPAGDRLARAVLEDGNGVLLWVPGLARAQFALPGDGGKGLTIGISETQSA